MKNIPTATSITSFLRVPQKNINVLERGTAVLPKIYHEVIGELVEGVLLSVERGKEIPLTYHIGDFVGPIKDGVISLEGFCAVNGKCESLDKLHLHVKCVAYTSYADFVFSVMQVPGILLSDENHKFSAGNQCSEKLKIVKFKLETRGMTYVATLKVSQILPTWMRPVIGDIQWEILTDEDRRDDVFHRPVFTVM
nr:hypothetical protein [uncultured Albidiferax sp.]